MDMLRGGCSCFYLLLVLFYACFHSYEKWELWRVGV